MPRWLESAFGAASTHEERVQGPLSGNRPEAAAERSEDRARTVAKPEVLDSGPDELCVDQEVALKADFRHRSTPRRYDAKHRHPPAPQPQAAPSPVTSSATQRLINR